MHAQCERCGASVPTRVESATRILCEICEPMTESAERRDAERDSVIGLEALIRRAGARPVERDDRISLEIVGAPHPDLGARPSVSTRRRPSVVWLAVGLLAGIVLTLSGTGLIRASAWGSDPSASAPARVELRREPSDKVLAEEPSPAPRHQRVAPPPRVEEPEVEEPQLEAPEPETTEPETAEPETTSAPPSRPRAETPAPRSGLPNAPTRAEVGAALAGRRDAIARCVEPAPPGSRAIVRVRFAGATGRVTHAEVTGGGDLPPEARSCIALATRDASVPRFDRDHIVVDYPYVL